jgi:hypothetical protein
LPVKVARLLAVKEGDHERVPTGTDLAGRASNAL